MVDLASPSFTLLTKTKETLSDGRFRWRSIKKFIYFACTYSSSAYNYDIFSKVCENVKLIEFILCEATIGIAYMCMDTFIKQYTRRYDCNKYMNPLLRGISYGRFLQTSLFVILHASYLADSLKFLAVSFREMPPWSICGSYNNTKCMPTTEIMVRCNRNTTTDFITTAAYFNYIDAFGALDRNTLTIRVFILGLVWILVFFFASVTEEAIVKIFKLSFMCRTLSTLVVFLFVVISTNDVATAALSDIVDISTPSELILSIKYVSYAYGIGFLGIHDFGVMSALTMIDTATVIFVVTFTAMAFMRSWIVKILFLVMKRCVDVDMQYGTHVMFYAILPLTTEFLYAHKLYVIYFYGNMMLGTLVYMTNLMYLLAKFLSYEIRPVKQIYIVGILCVIGFALSVPLIALMTEIHRAQSLTSGIDVAVLYLGGVYVAVVMWIYGLKRFCTDIQFWLNFRPTLFWKISWTLLPIPLFGFAIRRLYLLAQWEHSMMKWAVVGWVSCTFLIAAVMNIHAIAGFLIRNIVKKNLAGVFRPHKNYGPPELEDRKRRLYFSEFTRLRKCKHKCMVLDERFVCRHQRLVPESLSSSSNESSSQSSFDQKTTSQIDMSQLTPPS
ncbi:hypothetical protein PYW08_000411 [Mythimna loreyi]|uniref:Uncharacterized protein n=1 Tax=Mythimna loreyi TaxID=667449 RepID=A0ACC2RCJ1_9NEOP|nr:hypothetical protein PYW08_000411 [Mythimna loreyi]